MENQSVIPEDKENIWGPRVPIAIDIHAGIISAGQTKRPIDINGDITLALSTYLSMVYELRSQSSGVIPLRQDDLVVLADAFELDDHSIAEKLAKLMHCDEIQTKRFIHMWKRGRVLVPISMVAAGAVLAVSLNFGLAQPAPTVKSKVNVTEAIVKSNQKVDIGDAVQVERIDPSNAPVDNSNDGGSVVTKDSSTKTESAEPSNGSSQVQVKGQSVSSNSVVEEDEIQIGDAITLSRDDFDQ